jgi:ArsR family transcriptional regulator, arsenate/arsenite/antimonite-responsive transcriptional repressor / arsenate reductase (thioredoxin)
VNATRRTNALERRAAVHAALGDPIRLAIVDDLVMSDRSPRELGERLGVSSNLLAHHLDTLEVAGLVRRSNSSGDGRRKYVSLDHRVVDHLTLTGQAPVGEMLFLCTRNSARSQLASALWSARTGRPASSAGTHPARRVHRGAIAAARRIGLSLDHASPREISEVPKGVQVVTVCDMVHEEIIPQKSWWHWSIPDPVEPGLAASFDAVVQQLEARIATVMRTIRHQGGNK